MAEENSQQSAILKELSDIKSSLAVNTSETANIKLNITEIKEDIRGIKNESISRRELTDSLKAVRTEQTDGDKAIVNSFSSSISTLATNDQDKETRLRGLESKVWKAIGILLVVQIIFIPVLLYIVYKKLG